LPLTESQHDSQVVYGFESHILATIPDIHPGTTIVACVANSFAVAAAVASIRIVAAVCRRFRICADTQTSIAGRGLAGEEGRGTSGEGEGGGEEKAEGDEGGAMHV
jgi:hypothetical protein